jgi:Domain of unknown function (DUF4145)
MLDAVEQFQPDQKRRVIQCNGCQRRSIHSFECGIRTRYDDPHSMIGGGSENSIYRCGGCDSVLYVVDTWNSEHVFYNEDGEQDVGITTKQYPPITSNIADVDLSYCPDSISAVIEEAGSSLDNNNLLAATILARMTVEEICRDLKVGGGNLAQKIKKLAVELNLDQPQIELLDEIRKRGNAGAHEARAMSASEVKVVFEVLSTIIDSKYAAPGRAAKAVISATRHLKIKPQS